MRGFGNMGGLGNMGNLMKQAQKAMEQLQKAQEELANQRVEGTAGGGMVKAEANGLGQIVSVKIDKQAVDPEDVEMLEDLVLSAIHEAWGKSEELRNSQQQQLMGGMGLPPGMGL